MNAQLLENCFVFFFCSIEKLSVSFTIFALNNHVWMLSNFVHRSRARFVINKLSPVDVRDVATTVDPRGFLRTWIISVKN